MQDNASYRELHFSPLESPRLHFQGRVGRGARGSRDAPQGIRKGQMHDNASYRELHCSPLESPRLHFQGRVGRGARGSTNAPQGIRKG